jgi:hypothetical protein
LFGFGAAECGAFDAQRFALACYGIVTAAFGFGSFRGPGRRPRQIFDKATRGFCHDFPGMNSFSFSRSALVTGFSVAILTGSLIGQEPAAPVVPPANKDEVGVSSRDGITVSGGEALITRNGRTEKLTKEFALQNGLRVQPDGRLISKDGSSINLKIDQLLTFDGKIVALPHPVIPPPRAITPPPATPPGTAVPYTTPVPMTPRPHIKAGEGVQK